MQYITHWVLGDKQNRHEAGAELPNYNPQIPSTYFHPGLGSGLTSVDVTNDDEMGDGEGIDPNALTDWERMGGADFTVDEEPIFGLAGPEFTQTEREELGGNEEDDTGETKSFDAPIELAWGILKGV